MVILDVECYSNFFLISFLKHDTNQIVNYSSLNNSTINKNAISSIMSNNTTVSFNGNNYDLLMITAMLRGYDNSNLKRLSDRIITSGKPTWEIARDVDLSIPNNWDHIDLIEVAPGQSSLKIYGGRMNCERLQDLPIDPDAIISEHQAEQLTDYCANDLHTTAKLYDSLKAQIDLRISMSEQYNVDLRSKSDAQIAEIVLKSEIEQLTGRKVSRPELPKTYSFTYQNPKIIKFQTPKLNSVFEKLLTTGFTLADNGSVNIPDWLKSEKITIGKSSYQMGIGGLHSCEKSRTIRPNENQILADHDVASYYPSIILQQRLIPKTLGVGFLDVYSSIVSRRLAAKSSKNTVEANTLKIVLNGTFGKLGSKWSVLYAPDLLIQTTITGQLALLMLIEALELRGIHVVSANTDGIVILYDKSKKDDVDEIMFHWQLSTSYELEETRYKVLASRDVNTYLAVKPDDSYKGKGAFTKTNLSKNPDRLIIYDAVARFIINNTPIEKTIRECEDITKFITVRQVQGGAVWRGESIGKAVRFYSSTSVASDECLHYKKNNNRVPNSAGAKPLMELPRVFPNDVDYNAYIVSAEKLLCEVGAC